ncbi:MAG TPA: PKD domain-containing protein [Bacteriovoracaceae bacterium]|nr:PKD domain-containing protein [Bacteriovoracaceae bacterium]
MTKTLIVPALFLSFQVLAAPTGLKPLSPKELRHMQKNLRMRKIKDVKPTELGLKRINNERRRQGLPEMDSDEVRPMGRDTDIDQDDHNDFEEVMTSADSDAPSEIMTGVMPAAIDNSKLPSFPAIGNQAWNSCAAWAIGYYQSTHNNGMALGWTNNTWSDTSKKCSPKFIYNMINSGVDEGSYWSDAMDILQKHGCVTWDKWPEDSNYKAWNTNPDDWQAAISSRANAVQYVNDIDTATGLDQVKQLLNNGYVLTFGTYINSWQYSTIKPGHPLAGQQVMRFVNGTVGSHAMTIVGYDDTAWVDINNNNSQDAGELGVLKIANSWGTSWGHSGYIWVAYDALKTVSAIPGGPSSGRQPGIQSRTVFHQPVKAQAGVAYSPRYLAKVSVKHGVRSQMAMNFGHSSTAYSTQTSTFTPFATTSRGGPLAFNGTTMAHDATFIIDVSDLPISTTGPNKVYMTLKDSAAGNAGYLNSFELIDLSKSALTSSASAGLATPSVVDASQATVSLTYGVNQTPVAKITTSGTLLSRNFSGAGSTDADGTIASYAWSFGDGTYASGSEVAHTYSAAGTYTVGLAVTDNMGAVTSASSDITVTAADTIAPAVTLTSPLNGTRYARYKTVYAAATASDNVKVTYVKFIVNGYVKCTDYTAPYTCAFTMPYGSSIPVRAKAYDAAGNYKYSSYSYIKN